LGHPVQFARDAQPCEAMLTPSAIYGHVG